MIMCTIKAPGSFGCLLHSYAEARSAHIGYSLDYCVLLENCCLFGVIC